MYSRRSVLSVVAVAFIALAANLYASTSDYFLKIDGVQGESSKIVRCPDGQCSIEGLAPGSFTVTICDERGNPINDNFKVKCTFTPSEIRESPSKSSDALRESPTKASTGKTPITTAASEIVSPRDAASGLPTGKRMHKPVVFTKELDKSTPWMKVTTPTADASQGGGQVMHWTLEVRIDRIVMK